MLYCVAFMHSIYLYCLSPLNRWWRYPAIVVLLLSSKMSASGCRNQLTLCTKPFSRAGRIPTLVSTGSWIAWLCSLWPAVKGSVALATCCSSNFPEGNHRGREPGRASFDAVSQAAGDPARPGPAGPQVCKASAAAHVPGEHLPGI